jgi:hypothetical protein
LPGTAHPRQTALVREFELAQVNVARLLAPLDDPRLEDFVAGLDPVNALADAAPGFVWRLQTDSGNATDVEAFTWDADGSAGVIVNLSVWVDREHLLAFVHAPQHRAVLRRRREWFAPMRAAHTACWWVPAGRRPTTQEAEQRVRHLRSTGPTDHAFGLRDAFGPPSAGLTAGSGSPSLAR